MDTKLAKQKARKLLDQYGLIHWQFEFDNAIRRFGKCSFRKSIISLSKKLTELNDESIVTDTILHEIAHALVGKNNGHNHFWKMKALEIGCNGQRCYGDETHTPTARYTATCPNGHTSQKNRVRYCSCGKCSSVFDKRYLLTYTKN